MYLSRQLYEEALHVQFYLTLLDTYVPDPERAPRARSRRSRTSRRSSSKAEFCMRWIDSIQRARAARDARRSAGSSCSTSSASRRASRGCSSSAPSPTSTSCARAGLLHGLAGGHELGVPRRERAHGVRVRGRRRPCAARSPSSSTPTLERDVRAMIDEAIDVRDAVRRGPARRRRRRPVGRATCASTSSTAPTSGSPTLGLPQALRREEPVLVHGPAGRAGGRPTSSSAGCRPTRSA